MVTTRGTLNETVVDVLKIVRQCTSEPGTILDSRLGDGQEPRQICTGDDR